MTRYTKAEARDWARENVSGVNNVLIPSFTNDLRDINETAIRHDVRRELALGFSGALLVSEISITGEEYLRFTEVAADEAAGRLTFVHHAAFNTLEENIEMARRAGAAGADLALLSYPPSFYPRTEQDIYDYTKTFCDSVDLGVLLFPVPLWGFERIHPASISVECLERLVDDVPNVVGVKAEGGHPSVAGFVHVFHRLSSRVLVTTPILDQAIPLAALVPMQVMATSNTEYYGSAVPEMFAMVQHGKVDEALDLLWRIAPAWRANESVAPIPAAHSVHRMAWKYQAWLAGFNGGPLRMPTTRLVSTQMQKFRQALIDSGLPATTDPDERFFLGRNPT
jgi:4-hydroxy-tetrahydrodipicolinate synthase